MTIIFQLIASFIGTLSFAIIFNTPRRYYLYCGGIGSVGWAVYLLTHAITHSVLLATFVSALALIFLAREAAYGLRAPVTIFLICGIFCLVPGLIIYQFAYNFFIGDAVKAAKSLVLVIQISIAIALGILIGYEFPPRFFFMYRKRHKA